MVVLSGPTTRSLRRAPTLALALALAASLVVGCSSEDGGGSEGAGAGSQPVESTVPPADVTAVWPRATPAEAGLDPAVLDDVAAHAKRQGSDCFLVARDGAIVVDEAWRGTSPDDSHGVFSVTKSIASTLAGIAIHDGHLRLDDRVSDHVAAWRDDEHRDVTVRQVLSMTTGLERTDTDYFDLAGSQDRTATALALPVVARPGSTWAYSNGAVQVIEAVLREATGQPTEVFARERLFEPLGMRRTELHIDDAGHATLAFGATTTCRDLARLGQFVLDGGRAGRRQLVAPDWFEQATSSSSELNEGYGLLWWLNVEGRRLSSALAVSTEADAVIGTGRQVPGAPESIVWALGLGDQMLQIDPGTQTIVVRVGRGQALDEPDRFDEGDAARIVTEGVER